MPSCGGREWYYATHYHANVTGLKTRESNFGRYDGNPEEETRNTIVKKRNSGTGLEAKGLEAYGVGSRAGFNTSHAS
jgi:hypothetical protein